MRYPTILFFIALLSLLSCKQKIEKAPHTAAVDQVESAVDRKGAEAQKEGQKSSHNDLDFLIREPKIKQEKIPCLFLLHGLGSNEKDLLRIGQRMDDRLMVVSLQGPYSFNNMKDKYSWYPLQLRNGNYNYDFEMAKSSKNKILKIVKQLSAQYNLDEENIFIGGFSQGGVMSLYTALSTNDIFRGAISFSGYLPAEAKSEILKSPRDPDLEIFASHGTSDKKVEFVRAEITMKFIDSLKVKNTFYADNARHTVSPDHFANFDQWISDILDN